MKFIDLSWLPSRLVRAVRAALIWIGNTLESGRLPWLGKRFRIVGERVGMLGLWRA